MKKLKTGQKIWVVEYSYRGQQQEPRECEVSKVGNKYFTIDGMTRTKFDIESMIEVGSNYRTKCYLTLNEIEEEKEHGLLSDELRKCFGGYGKIQYTLEQLRQIKSIITK